MEPEHDYVCDRTGFALIYYSHGILQLYYYDFKRKFTTYIKIPFRLHRNINIILKLYNRTLWMELRNAEYNMRYFHDVTNGLAYVHPVIIKDICYFKAKYCLINSRSCQVKFHLCLCE